MGISSLHVLSFAFLSLCCNCLLILVLISCIYSEFVLRPRWVTSILSFHTGDTLCMYVYMYVDVTHSLSLSLSLQVGYWLGNDDAILSYWRHTIYVWIHAYVTHTLSLSL